MPKLLLILLLTLPGWAAITNVRVSDSTPVAAILRYVAPSPAACTLEVSESSTYSPLVPDVSTTLFTGSNSDARNGAQSRERTFIIGNAGTGIIYAPIALSGRRVSRALQTNTLHYYRITCGSDVVTGTFQTANIAPGDTFPVAPAPVDPAHLGENGWPYLQQTMTTKAIDPITGVLIQNLWQPESNVGGFSYAGPYPINPPEDTTGTWVNPNNSQVADGAVTTYTGSANAPLKVRVADIQLYLTMYVTGYVDNVSTTTEACLTVNMATCYGPWIPFTLPVGVGNMAQVAIGDPNENFTKPTPASKLAAWLSPGQQYPVVFFDKSGKASNVGNAVTMYGLDFGYGAFDTRWTTDTTFTYNSVNYKVLSVTDGQHMTISPTPPSNLTAVDWIVHPTGVLFRKSSVGGTVSIDVISLAGVGSVSQINDQGSGGSRQCTLSRYHQGFRIGQDRGSSLSAATNASPIVITTTSSHDYVTGDVVKIRDVPGNTAANGTWTVTVTGARTFSLNGSTGNGNFPSDSTDFVYEHGGGLVWKLTSSTGHLCWVSNVNGGRELYWINPDLTPKTIVYLGPFYTQGVGFDFGNIVKTQFGIISEEDPEVPSMYNVYVQSGLQRLWKGVYAGAQPTGMFQPGARWVNDSQQSPYIGIWKFTNLTPTQSVSDKLTAFDPLASGLDVTFLRSPKPGLLAFYALKGTQNSLGWMGIYNVVTNQVIALMNSWSNANARWAGIHTPFAWEGADQYSWVSYNLTGKDGESGPKAFSGPYRMTLTSGNMSATPTDCESQISALGQTNVLNVIGNNCSTVAVNSLQPITPSAATPPNDTLNNQAVRIGDLMKMNDQAAGTIARPWGNDESEIMKIVAIKTATSQMVVYRGWAGYDNAEFFPVTTHANGNFFYMFNASIPRWWDYVNAPHGETGTDPYSQNLNGNRVDKDFPDASHYFTRNGLTVSDGGGLSGVAVAGVICPTELSTPYGAAYGMRKAPWPNHITPDISAYGCTQGNPGFDGAYGYGFGNDLEKHPSPVDTSPNDNSFFDFRPYLTAPSFGDWGNPVTNQVTTKVAGTTYVYKTIRNGLNFAAFDEKRNRLYHMIGRRPGYDVSAPGFVLPDTAGYNYTYCMAHVAGECRAGSAIGDVYTNAPNVTPVPEGTGYDGGQFRCLSKQQLWIVVDFLVNDICITAQSPYADYSVQYSSDHDPYNTGARRITAGLRHPRTSGLTENVPATPSGNGLFMGSQLNQGANFALVMPKVPPYPGRQPGTNHGAFIPIPIKLASVPAGTNNVLVEFGYDPNFRCTTRQESCIANAASIQSGASVYFYASDTYSGLSCASGCTPVIPALSQRILWYRLKYRNASNLVIKTGEAQTLATP